MANYVKLINDYGTYLVGDGASNVSVKASGSGTSINVSGCTAPLIAVRCTGGWCNAVRQSLSGSTLSATIDADAGASVSWWVLDEAKAQSPSSYGLVCYDAAGNLIFDALQQQARYIGVMSGVLWTPGSQSFAGTPAVVVAKPANHTVSSAYLVTPGNPPLYGLETTRDFMRFRLSGSTVQTDTVTTTRKDPGIYALPGTYHEFGSNNYRLLVVDVTNY